MGVGQCGVGWRRDGLSGASKDVDGARWDGMMGGAVVSKEEWKRGGAVVSKLRSCLCFVSASRTATLCFRSASRILALWLSSASL